MSLRTKRIHPQVKKADKMADSPQEDTNVRRITLHSDKVSEIVSLNDPSGAAKGLHVCPACTSELVYPVAWEEADRAHWEVSLRCPNCGWEDTDTFNEEAIQRFDEMLDRGTESLIADLRQFSQARMREDIERLITALNGDHLLPEDF